MVLEETCQFVPGLEVGKEASHVSRPVLFATRKASFRYGGRDNAFCPFLGKEAVQIQEKGD